MVEIFQLMDAAQDLVPPAVDQLSRTGGSRDFLRQQSKLQNLDPPQ